jgi:hypothetical protein
MKVTATECYGIGFLILFCHLRKGIELLSENVVIVEYLTEARMTREWWTGTDLERTAPGIFL